MYKYLVAFVLSMPLIGIWFVEQGEFAMSIGVPGEANGATLAFAVYVAIIVGVALLCGGAYKPRRAKAAPVVDLAQRRREYEHFSRRLVWLNIAFLAIMLIGFGGIRVWLGTIEKGLFRATLGPFGSVAYLLTKFAVPAAFAYSTLLMMKVSEGEAGARWRIRRLWYLNTLLVFMAGSSWGFKTTGLFMLLPGLLILNWRLPAKRLVLFCAAFATALVLFFFWFDAELMEDTDVLTFLATRLTVLQGDVAWYVYGLRAEGEPLPNYWPTLLAAFGDTFLSMAGVSKDNAVEWMGYHYDWMITVLSGSPLEYVANGHSVTATPFAEGLVAGGLWGVLLFAVLGGLLVGRTYFHLDRAIQTERVMTAALLSTYFCFHIFSWLNGGAVTQLFHISVIFYVLATSALLSALRLKPPRRPATAAVQPPLPLSSST